jgi:hypothetical protein
MIDLAFSKWIASWWRATPPRIGLAPFKAGSLGEKEQLTATNKKTNKSVFALVPVARAAADGGGGSGCKGRQAVCNACITRRFRDVDGSLGRALEEKAVL